MHHGNDRNRKIRRFSTSSFSSHELNEPLNKNTPSLDFNDITPTSELPESYTYNYEPPTFPPFMPFMENFQEFEVPAESSKDPNSLQFTYLNNIYLDLPHLTGTLREYTLKI
ncbi:hypothetical protein RirG_086220 [Rhizophagus irregularis DAOM 197198w]|uniref:Uncharacterized protein n=1 Tax=Rhizophagus irregularis (strain DAOM 197198w) TaxID=1432141 RepID=A0A015KSG8_RHIIW|nr:hypothetical protein RirG_086220 [Rhizophagus irregularis DAOM 197198w]